MTLVRRVAVRISGFVVDHASSGCWEWAEGLAREVEFVEGDWAALWWALGSLRVLLDRREDTVRSLSEASFKARQFRESLNERNYLFMIISYLVFRWALQSVNAHHGLERVGSGFVLLGWWGEYFFRSMRRRVVARATPDGDDAREWAIYYRFVLERMCRPRFLMVKISPLVFCAVGFLATFQGEGGIRSHSVSYAIVVVVSVLVSLFWIQEQRWIHLQIAALGAVLDEVGNGDLAGGIGR